MYTNIINTNNIDSVIPAFEEKISPFSLFAGETVETYAPVSSYHVTITDLDKLIITQLNTYRILTSSLIYQSLLLLGLKNTNETAVKNRLRALTEAQFVTKTEFLNANGTSVMRCYSVGYRGRGLLKALAANQRLTGYISSLANDPIRIKKILSANQYLIRTGISIDKIEVCQTILSQTKFKDKTEYIFRPHSIIFNENSTHIIESVRQNEDWQNDLKDKLGRIAAVFKRKEHNIELTNPEVVLIAENMTHMKEIMKVVSEHKYHFSIVFSCDSMTYIDPEHCHYQLNNEKSVNSFLKKVIGF